MQGICFLLLEGCLQNNKTSLLPLVIQKTSHGGSLKLRLLSFWSGLFHIELVRRCSRRRHLQCVEVGVKVNDAIADIIV